MEVVRLFNVLTSGRPQYHKERRRGNHEVWHSGRGESRLRAAQRDYTRCVGLNEILLKLICQLDAQVFVGCIILVNSQTFSFIAQHGHWYHMHPIISP